MFAKGQLKEKERKRRRNMSSVPNFAPQRRQQKAKFTHQPNAIAWEANPSGLQAG